MKILSDIMDLLFSADVGPTIHDVTEVMLTTLRTVIQTTIAMDRESPLVVSASLSFQSHSFHDCFSVDNEGTFLHFVLGKFGGSDVVNF